MTIRNVTVLGTGVLGSQIAYLTAYCGFAVTAYDFSDELLAKARRSFEKLAARHEREVSGAAGGPARAALGRISYLSDLGKAVHDADLVIESVPAYDIYAASEDPKLRVAARDVKEHYIDQGKLGQPMGEGSFKYSAAHRRPRLGDRGSREESR